MSRRVDEFLQVQSRDTRVAGLIGDYGLVALMRKLDDIDIRLATIEQRLERLDVHYAAILKYNTETRRHPDKAAL